MTNRILVVAVLLSLLGSPQAQSQSDTAREDESSPVKPISHCQLTHDTPMPDVCGCDDGSCGGACCASEYFGPNWQFFGEYLYIRPGKDKVSYAVPINGGIVPPAGAPPVQVGPEAVVDCNFKSGFRTGFSRALNSCADLGVTYTYLESDIFDQMSIDPLFVIRSLVNHPGTVAAPTDFLDANANYEIRFDLIDIDYRRALVCGERSALRYFIGVRYANLEQQFDSRFSNSTMIETVTSDVRFDGGGIRVGLEGERHARNLGLMIYGRGAASFLGGEFRGRYAQGDSVRGDLVDTGWREDRIVSVLDFELGIGWASRTGSLRLTAGYFFSAWCGVIQTDEFIRAVRSNDSVSIDDTITFDGLVVRTELLY